MTSTRGYDLHAHLAPRFDSPPGLGVERRPDGRYRIAGTVAGPPDLYRPDRLLAALDDAGLQHAVVSVPPPFFRQDLPDRDDSRRWVAALNDGLRHAVDGHERLLPLAYLPLEHPDLAVDEYRRRRAEGGWVGFTASAGGGSRSLADPELDDLWAMLSADGRLLQLHPGPPADPRLTELYLHNLVGFPMETTIAAGQLVLADVLRRFSGMRVLLLHCGGAVPALAGRWDRGVRTGRPGLPDGLEPPLDAVRRFFVDCLALHPAALDLAVAVVGPDRVVVGTDWPFPMGSDVVGELRRDRDERFVDDVLHHNALLALGIGSAEQRPGLGSESADARA